MTARFGIEVLLAELGRYWQNAVLSFPYRFWPDRFYSEALGLSAAGAMRAVFFSRPLVSGLSSFYSLVTFKRKVTLSSGATSGLRLSTAMAVTFGRESGRRPHEEAALREASCAPKSDRRRAKWHRLPVPTGNAKVHDLSPISQEHTPVPAGEPYLTPAFQS